MNRMRECRRLRLSLASRVLGVAFCVLILTLSSEAKAGFIQAFSGNTAPTDGVRVMSTLNFAVLDTTGGAGTDTWGTGYANFDTAFMPGTGSPKAVDTTAEYLYLYQVTNDWPAGNANYISFTTIPLAVPLNDITSWGFFAGLGLSDAFGPVTSANFFGNTRTARQSGGRQHRRDEPIGGGAGRWNLRDTIRCLGLQ